jgi:hypothetical protein
MTIKSETNLQASDGARPSLHSKQMSDVGWYIKKKRLGAKLSLSGVAKALQVSPPYLLDVERGNRRIAFTKWFALANVVRGIEVDEIAKMSIGTVVKLWTKSGSKEETNMLKLLMYAVNSGMLDDGACRKMSELIFSLLGEAGVDTSMLMIEKELDGVGEDE